MAACKGSLRGSFKDETRFNEEHRRFLGRAYNAGFYSACKTPKAGSTTERLRFQPAFKRDLQHRSSRFLGLTLNHSWPGGRSLKIRGKNYRPRFPQISYCKSARDVTAGSPAAIPLVLPIRQHQGRRKQRPPDSVVARPRGGISAKGAACAAARPAPGFLSLPRVKLSHEEKPAAIAS